LLLVDGDEELVPEHRYCFPPLAVEEELEDLEEPVDQEEVEVLVRI